MKNGSFIIYIYIFIISNYKIICYTIIIVGDDDMQKEIKIVGIAGSLRKGSFNKNSLMAAKELLPEGSNLEIVDISNLPFFNEDVESVDVPKEVVAFKNKLEMADAILIATPEYNYSIPGVLKNLLDWLSRPLIQYDFQGPSAVHEKKVTISGVAGGSAAANVRKQLAVLLPFIRMNLIGGEGTGVSLTAESFRTDELQLDDEVKFLLNKQVEEFLNEI